MAAVGFAQTKTETLKVSGECGSCKKKIESAAKKAGASYAVWDVDSKELTVKYNSTTTNNAKIQKSIAGVGYDTQDFKATDEAYNKLDGCCQYDRTAKAETKSADSTSKN
jgi:periplasmic mercuric ion binding protein